MCFNVLRHEKNENLRQMLQQHMDSSARMKAEDLLDESYDFADEAAELGCVATWLSLQDFLGVFVGFLVSEWEVHRTSGVSNSIF